MADTSFQLFARPKGASGRKRRREEESNDAAAPTGAAAPGEAVAAASDASEARTFADLGLAPWVVRAASALALTRPTPIQRGCVPAILAGRDGMGSAPTGSGKTAAFALPILQRIGEDPWGIAALILTPSRELAAQIGDAFTALGSSIKLRVCVLTGGVDFTSQACALSARPHVLIATPGRLAEHVTRSPTPPDLKRLRFLVLDEADRVLEPSMRPDVDAILHAAAPSSASRTTLLFTATMTLTAADMPPNLNLAADAFNIDVSGGGPSIPPALAQYYTLVPAAVKVAYLPHLLQLLLRGEGGDASSHAAHDSDLLPPRGRNAIVFFSTCRAVQHMYETLRALGVESAPLHSILPQTKRLASLARFKSSLVRILLATDVASRGLDIPAVDVVINFDLPSMPSDYIHRVGRTARAGRGGVALSMVTQYDVALLHAVEEHALRGVKLPPLPGVDEDAVTTTLTRVATATQTAKMKLVETGFEEMVDSHKQRKAARRAAAGSSDAGRSGGRG